MIVMLLNFHGSITKHLMVITDPMAVVGSVLMFVMVAHLFLNIYEVKWVLNLVIFPRLKYLNNSGWLTHFAHRSLVPRGGTLFVIILVCATIKFINLHWIRLLLNVVHTFMFP